MVWKQVKDYNTLWNEVSENLTELSRIDKVKYYVRATEDSIEAKIKRVEEHANRLKTEIGD